MAQFSSAGSAGQMALYWAPESSCSLVTWQTAYSALIEGDHAKCQGLAPPRVTEMITMSAATSATAPPRFTNVPTTSPATTSIKVTATSHPRGRKMHQMETFVETFLSKILLMT